MNSHQAQLVSRILVVVCFLDGRPEEAIFVKLLSPRLYPDLRRAFDDEAVQAELFSGRDASYIDSLRPESIEVLVLAGWSLNRDHVNRNASRRLENTAQLAGPILEMIESFEPEIQALMPDEMAEIRELAASTLKKGLPEFALAKSHTTQTTPLEIHV